MFEIKCWQPHGAYLGVPYIVLDRKAASIADVQRIIEDHNTAWHSTPHVAPMNCYDLSILFFSRDGLICEASRDVVGDGTWVVTDVVRNVDDHSGVESHDAVCLYCEHADHS